MNGVRPVSICKQRQDQLAKSIFSHQPLAGRRYLEDDAAECPEVGGATRRLVMEDLGRHVRRCAAELVHIAALVVLVLSHKRDWAKVRSKSGSCRCAAVNQPHTFAVPKSVTFKWPSSLAMRRTSVSVSATPHLSAFFSRAHLKSRLSGLISRWMTCCSSRMRGQHCAACRLYRDENGHLAAPTRPYLRVHVLECLDQLCSIEPRRVQVARCIGHLVLLLLLALIAAAGSIARG
jgi:hypothetical protein